MDVEGQADHALLYVTEQSKAQSAVPVYVDLRNMGSSGGVYADTQIPLAQRATRLLLDVLASIHEAILAHVIAADLDLATLGPILDRLGTAITELEVVGEVKRELRDIDAFRPENRLGYEAELVCQAKLGGNAQQR